MLDVQAAAAPGDDVATPENVPARIVAAWAANDAEAFAAAFTEDGSMILPGDVYVTGREQIRTFMTTAFAGPYQGTRVTGNPLAMKQLGPDVVSIITRGGVLAPGETEVSASGAIRATWLLTKQGSEWLIAGYQNTSIAA